MADAGRKFQRKGEVQARQLSEPVDWTTERGDVLHGELGDWWVTSPDGAVRTVAAADFAETYAHIEGDRYQRFGVFQARRAVEVEVIPTPEGTATAHPGDWVVTDPNGNSWPVPDPVFRAGYQPVD